MRKTASKNLIVIMAKEPVPGQVKTRLSPEISPEEAAALSRCFLEDRIAEVNNIDSANLAIAYTPDTARDSFIALAPARFNLFPQKGADLGQRMQAIVTDQTARGYARVCIVGSDSPDLPASMMIEALRLLEVTTTDIVLGPSLDGGYYLIAMRKSYPELFTDIAWGSPNVIEETLKKIKNEGLTAALLEPWLDIDTFTELVAFHATYSSNTDCIKKQRGAKTLAYLTTRIFTQIPS